MCKRINRFLPILLIAYLGGSILVSYILMATGINVPLWVDMILSQLLLLIPGIVYVIVSKINVLKCLPYKLLGPLDAVLCILFGYTVVPLMLLINNFSMLFSHNRLADTASGIFEYPFLFQILLMAVIPPLVEEFMFRGLFYHSYRKNGIVGAALVSGVIFGMIHLNINQFCYAFVLGIIFALLVEATNSMFASILTHFAINTYSIIMTKLVSGVNLAEEQQAQQLSDFPLPTIIATFVMLIMLVATFGCVAFIIYRLLAIRHGNWEKLTTEFKQGIRQKNGERFITIPLIITVIVCFAFMIGTEYLM